MQKVIATFPDTVTLAEFIFDNSISNAVVNSKDQTLTTHLTDAQIEIARTKHDAYIEIIVILPQE